MESIRGEKENTGLIDLLLEIYDEYKDKLTDALNKYILIGGYPRTQIEFYETTGSSTSDARYLSDIFRLITSDITKFKNRLSTSFNKWPHDKVVSQLENLIQLHSNPTSLIGEQTFKHIKDPNFFLEYLKLSFSIGYLRNLQRIDSEANIVISSSDHKKYFYRDPFVYWAFYFGSRHETNIFSKSKELIKKEELIGSLYEAIVISHLYNLAYLKNSKGEELVYAYVKSMDNKEMELCGAVLTYSFKNRRIILPFEISKRAKDTRDLHIEEVKKSLGVNRLIMVNGEGKFEIQEDVAYVPIDLLLLVL